MSCFKSGEFVLGDGTPKICVPLVGKTDAEILQEAKAIREAKPDLAEWRVDFYDKVTDDAAVADMLPRVKEALGEVPLLFTFRTKQEGGNRAITAEDYSSLNLLAARSGKTVLIDVEIDMLGSETLIPEIQAAGGHVIASHHNFSSTPSYVFMTDKLCEMDEKGADVVKLAVMPQSEMDVLRLMQTTVQMKEKTEKPVVTMSMSALGAISRISGALTGSALTFATLGAASAPGQIPLHEMRQILEQMKI